MISNFAISENENPNLTLFRKLKENGRLLSLKNNIQNDFKEQQYVPQNAFTRLNLPKILKTTQNFTKDYLGPTAFKHSFKKTLEPFAYKTIGKINFSTDSKLIYKMNFEKEDKKLQHNQVKIINKLIRKKKLESKFPTMKAFYEKMILWLAKTKNSCKVVEPLEVVTLLKSLHNSQKEKKIEIDEQIFKSRENDENFEYEELQHTGIVYPKFENIIDFFEISPPNKAVVIKKGFNLMVRENDLFQRHLDDTLECSFWKIKDIKRFFIFHLKSFKKFEVISAKLQKNEQECRTLFRLTAEFFGLKTGFKDIKRSKTKDISKEIIKEVFFLIFLTEVYHEKK